MFEGEVESHHAGALLAVLQNIVAEPVDRPAGFPSAAISWLLHNRLLVTLLAESTLDEWCT